jgi:chitin disaccharide deacetylase
MNRKLLMNQPSTLPGDLAKNKQIANTDALLSPAGLLIINADDWGRTPLTTDRILDSVRCGSVSAVSAMVFMEDSERAAQLAHESAIDTGLHLNLTTPFTASQCAPPQLAERQQQLAAFLCRHSLARVLFNPFLSVSFEYVVKAQIDEFRRLYGAELARIDGHHHIHLCSNVLFKRLLPSGTHVRRNFSFQAEEKNVVNRLYRGWQDRMLARRHHLDAYFFSLPPLEPVTRLERIFSLATLHTVEVETHPVNAAEYNFLQSPQFHRLMEKFHLPFPLPAASTRYATPAESRFKASGG